MQGSVSVSHNSRPGNLSRARGFSLIEMLIAVAIVTAVIAVVVQGITKMQRRSFLESSKVDTVQETRAFIAQMVRDIHNVGYPAPKVNPFPGSNCNPTDNANVSCGPVFFTPQQTEYQAGLNC